MTSSKVFDARGVALGKGDFLLPQLTTVNKELLLKREFTKNNGEGFERISWTSPGAQRFCELLGYFTDAIGCRYSYSYVELDV